MAQKTKNNYKIIRKWRGWMPQEVITMVTETVNPDREKALDRRSTDTSLNPWNEMERWFDEFDRRGWLNPMTRLWPLGTTVAPFEGKTPKVDVLDRENEFVVRAELPGVRKDDLEVTVTDHTVALKAHTEHEEKEEEGEYVRREMSYGRYQRTLELPQTVDEAKAKATFTDGVLELTLPKLEKTPQRTVRVE
jgi:HSP20 family protein